jgi:hypothetical protein
MNQWDVLSYSLLTGTKFILAIPFATHLLFPSPAAEIKIRDNTPFVLKGGLGKNKDGCL